MGCLSGLPTAKAVVGSLGVSGHRGGPPHGRGQPSTWIRYFLPFTVKTPGQGQARPFIDMPKVGFSISNLDALQIKIYIRVSADSANQRKGVQPVDSEAVLTDSPLDMCSYSPSLSSHSVSDQLPNLAS